MEKKADRHARKGGKKAAVASRGAEFSSDESSSGSSPQPARISGVVTRTTTTLRGTRPKADDHPRLDVVMTFPTASGYVDIKIDRAD